MSDPKDELAHQEEGEAELEVREEKGHRTQQKAVLRGKWKEANEGQGFGIDCFSGFAAPGDNSAQGPKPRRAGRRTPPAGHGPASEALRRRERGGAGRPGEGGAPAGAAQGARASWPARPLQDPERPGLSCGGSPAPPPLRDGFLREAGAELGAEGVDPARGQSAGRRIPGAKGR